MKKKPPLFSLALSALLTMGVSAPALAQSASDRAVEAAKQYAGTEITIVWEAGLQALDPLNFSGPKWKELTGIDVSVVEVPTAEMFTKILQEHRAGTGAYDALNVIPSWMADLVRAGALEPLDEYVDEYGYREELQEIAPVYRDNQMTVDGTIYGFPDDGDVFILYYRKDIFEENGLEPPKTWQEFAQICNQLTEKYAPDMYGAGMFRQNPYPQFLFQERFRVEGGKFFDAETMEATINDEVGVKVLTEMREENKCMPPGVECWGFVENLAAFLAGDIAMTVSWPPYGRWAAGYGTDEEALAWSRSRRSRARSATPCRRAGTRSSPPASRSPSPPAPPTRRRPTCSSSGSTARRSRSSACSCPMRCAIRSARATSRARSTSHAGRMRPPTSRPCRRVR